MPTPLSRRTLWHGGPGAAVAATAGGCSPPPASSPVADPHPSPLGPTFPTNFAWGVATAAYQTSPLARGTGRMVGRPIRATGHLGTPGA